MRMLTLYQAEWCPFSSAVREILTELGLDFEAKQVEPWPEERATLRRLAGTERIPTLVAVDGDVYVGTRRIFEFLETVGPWRHEREHRRRFDEHEPARERDVTGRLVGRFRGDEPGEPVTAPVEAARVIHRPEERRYELYLEDRVIGRADYERRGDAIVFTHTEVDKACEGRGFGSRLVGEALEDAERAGLRIVPLCPFVRAYLKRRAAAPR